MDDFKARVLVGQDAVQALIVSRPPRDVKNDEPKKSEGNK